MPDSKFFSIPFGTSGDRATIPEASQPNGAISYQQGFGPDYERNPANDPLAKRVPRDETNEFYYQVSNALKFLQLYGLPEWYAADGSGTPVSYPVTARVRHGGKAWISIAASNTAQPGTDATKWLEDTAFNLPDLEATPTETLVGTAANKLITPRRLAAGVQVSGWNYAETGGTASAWTASYSPAPVALSTLVGVPLRLKVSSSNTGSVTLNVNGFGAVGVVDANGFPLPSGFTQVGNVLFLVYDGNAFRVIGGHRPILSPFSIQNGTSQTLSNGNIAQVSPGGNTSFTNIGSLSGAAFTFSRAGNYFVICDMTLVETVVGANSISGRAFLRLNGGNIAGGSSEDQSYAPISGSYAQNLSVGTMIAVPVGAVLTLHALVQANSNFTSGAATSVGLAIFPIG